MTTENLALIGAPAAYESTLPAEHTKASIELATADLLADVDTFTEELGGACMGQANVSSDWFMRQPHRLAEADDARVLHIALVSEDRGDTETALQALGLLKRRYLERNDARLRARSLEYAEAAAERNF